MMMQEIIFILNTLSWKERSHIETMKCLWTWNYGNKYVLHKNWIFHDEGLSRILIMTYLNTEYVWKTNTIGVYQIYALVGNSRSTLIWWLGSLMWKKNFIKQYLLQFANIYPWFYKVITRSFWIFSTKVFVQW